MDSQIIDALERIEAKIAEQHRRISLLELAVFTPPAHIFEPNTDAQTPAPAITATEGVEENMLVRFLKEKGVYDRVAEDFTEQGLSIHTIPIDYCSLIGILDWNAAHAIAFYHKLHEDWRKYLETNGIKRGQILFDSEGRCFEVKGDVK